MFAQKTILISVQGVSWLNYLFAQKTIIISVQGVSWLNYLVAEKTIIISVEGVSWLKYLFAQKTIMISVQGVTSTGLVIKQGPEKSRFVLELVNFTTVCSVHIECFKLKNFATSSVW